MIHAPVRRRFIAEALTLAYWLAPSGSVLGQPTQKFDLAIRGGIVVDPARGLQARADLGIRAGRIASIESRLGDADATRTIDASGQYVVPALIDMHARIYAGDSGTGAPADELAAASGITAWVSVAEVGTGQLSTFAQYRARHQWSRLYAFARLEQRTGSFGAAADEAIALELTRHRDIVLGLALHLPAPGAGAGAGVDALERALQLLQRSQTRGRVLCHIDAAVDADDIVARLRPGDILTHPYRGAGNAFFDDGRFRSSLVAARNRGVVLDVGGGGAHVDPQVVRIGLEQGLLPDVISSGVRLGRSRALAQPRLTDVMSTFLNLGLSLDQVLAMTTVNPARIIAREPHLGTLTLGAPADVALLRLSGRNTSIPQAPDALRIEPTLTLRSGVPLPRLMR